MSQVSSLSANTQSVAAAREMRCSDFPSSPETETKFGVNAFADSRTGRHAAARRQAADSKCPGLRAVRRSDARNPPRKTIAPKLKQWEKERSRG